MRYAHLVMGPAGCGKSTYCSTIAKHGQVSKRAIKVVNLDPAAEHFDYDVMADIRDLIHLDDVMEDKDSHLGPNGGLVFCMEYLMENMDWLQGQLGDMDEDYILFDCPGQIEIYTHLNVMQNVIECLHNWDFRVCGIFVIDTTFMVDRAKFTSGTLAALANMANTCIPHVNVLSKMDLLNKGSRKTVEQFLNSDVEMLFKDDKEPTGKFEKKYQRLSMAIATLVDDMDLVRFFPLDISDEECIEELLLVIDNKIQYGEDLDVRTKDFDDVDPDQE